MWAFAHLDTDGEGISRLIDLAFAEFSITKKFIDLQCIFIHNYQCIKKIHKK